MSMTQQRRTFYEFFAGAGLARLGLGPAWHCCWANDNDPRKAEVYRANFGDRHLILEDVARVRGEDLPKPATLAWASFPCQDLSLAGWRKGMSAGRSGTFWAFWRIMRELQESGARPPVIVLENVVGLLYGESFRGLAEALAALNMQFGALVIDAARFLPQSRPRVFVVAVDDTLDCGAFHHPEPDDGPWFPRSIRNAHASLTNGTERLWRWWRIPVPTRPVGDVASLIQDEPTGCTWHSSAETTRLLALMDANNRAKVDTAAADGKRRVGFVYKRTRVRGQQAEVRFDGIAGCLRTPSGGSSRQTVLVVDGHGVRSRLLSPREAARLMGVPDTFVLPSRYNDAYYAMGDAVAVPVVSWLSRNLLRHLATTAEAQGLTSSQNDSHSVEHFRKSSERLAAEWAASKV